MKLDIKRDWLLYVAAVPLTAVILGLGIVSSLHFAKAILKGK